MKRIVLMLMPSLICCIFLSSCADKAKPEVELYDKSETPPKTFNNVSFTPCQKSELRSSSEFSDKVDVEFTSKSVQITHYKFAVTCDFTSVNVTHTFVNGVLNITQQGTPNQANCICYTDVSYIIDGISQDEVNVIFINGKQVYCHNDNESTEKLDTIIIIKMNEYFVTNTMTVSFVEVTDNRCAKSQCHLCWGSKADILLSITDLEIKDLKIDLSIVGCVAYDNYDDYISTSSVDTLGYRFQLIRLSPYPDIETINKDDYIAKIKITKLRIE